MEMVQVVAKVDLSYLYPHFKAAVCGY